MQVPFEKDLGPSGTIKRGPHKGEEQYFRTALYNTLLAVRPRVCLEIGTWLGGTVRIFERYFDEYQPNGCLVTADVKKYDDVASDRVRQVQVYPHVEDFGHMHAIQENELLPYWRKYWPKSVVRNTVILVVAVTSLEEKEFDFAFIDGDHRTASAQRDLEIVRQLLAPPQYILLEDIHEGIHEISPLWESTLRHESPYYDFADWPVLAGTALIWSN